MRVISRGVFLCIAILLSACSGEGANQNGGRFDFYVFALTWSPSFCATEEETESAQCSANGPEGFVVHGLWPQFEKGYPEYCDHPEKDSFRRNELAALRDLYPSNALIRYQWRKHGSCSGLSRSAYFATVRMVRDRVRIPSAFIRPDKAVKLSASEIESAFVAANPGLRRDAISLTCRDSQLYDVRICVSKDLEFRACPEMEKRSCKLPAVAVPARMPAQTGEFRGARKATSFQPTLDKPHIHGALVNRPAHATMDTPGSH